MTILAWLSPFKREKGFIISSDSKSNSEYLLFRLFFYV